MESKLISVSARIANPLALFKGVWVGTTAFRHFMKKEIQTPPCECYYCQEWIDYYELYRLDFLGRVMCLDCYKYIIEDYFDKPD